MTLLQWSGEAEVETYAQEPDMRLNVGEAIAVMRVPTADELRQLWSRFNVELVDCVRRLFTTPNRHVLEQYGSLTRAAKNYEGRDDQLWGVAPLVLQHPKGLQRITSKAALRALAELNLVELKGKGGGQVRDNTGGLANFIASLTAAQQKAVIDAVLAPEYSLDEALIVDQASWIGLSELADHIDQKPDAEAFLEYLARECHTHFFERSRKDIASTGKRAGRWFAPIWFSMFLAREGVWLLPPTFVSNIATSYPAWARPVQVWMALPPSRRPFGDMIMRDYLAKRDSKPDNGLVVTTLVATSLVSNIWHADGLRALPLVGLKQWLQSKNGASSSQRNWAINRLWDAAGHFYEAPIGTHPQAYMFALGPKLAKTGTRAFNWVHNPNKQNLGNWIRIYGDHNPTESDLLKNWAESLEQLLSLFQVKDPQVKIDSLNTWLLFLAGLGESAPRTFKDVVRETHINDPSNPSARTFFNFLREHFVAQSASVAQRAMSDLRQAWELAAIKDNYAGQRANPIDPNMDTPIKAPNRRGRTVRKALDHRALEVIANENLRDDMAFAREFGGNRRTCWRWIRDPITGERQEVFFPAAPLMVHIIAHSGMRGSQGRWLDTGEGDELVPHVETKSYQKNEAPTAIRGRREGFLRLSEIGGPNRDTMVGMWVNTGKSGPHEVPWIHPDLIDPVVKMIKFQSYWNPISAPIKCDDPSFLDAHKVAVEETSFPLFRDPDNKFGLPYTQGKLLDYWRALLAHCQPLVDEAVGYHYPLVLNDSDLNFDIHSLRVTVVTTLLENGVPVSVVQLLVGHKSPIMTWYYQDVADAKVHRALQAAAEVRKTKVRDIHEMSAYDENELLNEVVTFRTEEDFVGREFFRRQRMDGNFIDVFAHGICPGGDCGTGGARLAENRYGPVWRNRACSSCRFRITGPAFLNGLIQRLNGITWELKCSMRKAAELEEEIEAAEDRLEGANARPDLRSQVRHEHEIREKLWEEWCVEYRTVKAAEAELHKQAEGDGTSLAMITQFDVKDMALGFREVHEFALAHTLVHDSRIVAGSSLDLPNNIEEYRDLVLLGIASANNIEKMFYSIDKKTRRKAMDAFGHLIVSHATSHNELQALIDGKTLISDLPALEVAMNEALFEAIQPAAVTAG